MKIEVLNYFKSLPKSLEEQFNTAFQLFRKCPAKSMSQLTFYNRAGFSKNNLKSLHYDLKKAAGVSDAEIKAAISSSSNKADLERKAAVEKQSKKIIELTDATTAEEVFTKAPENIKTQIKLRDEFPFLNDDDCPEEFYILVGKKFNHYDAYVQAHKSLLVKIEDTNQDASPIELTPEEIDTLAQKAVENFEVNQLIWNELNHYKETGKVLGKHPIFLERKLKESVESLTFEKATKRISALEKNIKRNQEKANAAKKQADKEKYQTKVEEYTFELNLIKVKFNFSDAK